MAPPFVTVFLHTNQIPSENLVALAGLGGLITATCDVVIGDGWTGQHEKVRTRERP